MYPEDRVLVAYMPEPRDFKIVKEEGWYRIPEKHAPKGIHAEYIAFYFGSKFGDEKWAIHYFARRMGFELLRRIDLLPNEPDHPRAEENYYKISLGPVEKLEQPITSLRYHRITFLHTTWDRFQDAREMNDLLVQGGAYVDRLFATLRERGVLTDQDFRISEAKDRSAEPIVIRCRHGEVIVNPSASPITWEEADRMADDIESQIRAKGGAEELT